MGFFKEYWKGGEGQTEAAYHSSSFHSFFEGYVEQKQTDPKTGRTKIVRIYTAPYRVRCDTDSRWLAEKLCTLLAYLCSVTLLILAATVLELEEPAKYYQFFIAGSLICDFILLYILLRFLSAPRRMTVGDYRGICPKLYQAALVSAVLVFLAIPARLINAVLTHSRFSLTLAAGFLCLAGSGASMLWLFLREKKAVYRIEDNEQADVNGFLVQR